MRALDFCTSLVRSDAVRGRLYIAAAVAGHAVPNITAVFRSLRVTAT